MNKDYFDNTILLKIIGAKLKKIANEKGFNLTQWANRLGEENIKVKQGDLSNILNGKRGASSEKLLEICIPIGITEKSLNNIIKEAEKEEFNYKYGEDIDDPESVDIEFEVALRKEYGREIDDETMGKIRDFIRFVKEDQKKSGKN